MNLQNTHLQKDKKLALKEFKDNKGLKNIPFKPDATKFVLSNGAIVTFTAVNSPVKSLIFKCLNLIHYKINFTDEMHVSSTKTFNEKVPAFVTFLNNGNLDNFNILKLYETYRVESGVKSQSTGMKEIRSFINKARESNSFIESLIESEIISLQEISKTKIAPIHDSNPLTMTVWFSWHTWLRREDIGVGAELYARLVSPKTVIRSFNITIEVGLLEVQKAKYALIDFFKIKHQCFDRFPEFISKKTHEENNLNNNVNYTFMYYLSSQANTIINILREGYHSIKEPSNILKNAMVIVIFSLAKLSCRDFVLDKFFKNKVITNQIPGVGVTCSSYESPIFSSNCLIALFNYSCNSKQVQCPVTYFENLFFTWIMASLRVQPSDIPKLRLSDFRFVKKQDGSIVSFECMYFKGRAQRYHTTELINGDSIKGITLINFFNDRTFNMVNRDVFLSTKVRALAVRKISSLAKILEVLNDKPQRINIKNEHNKQKIPMLILPSLIKIFTKGISFPEYKRSHKIHIKDSSYVEKAKANWQKNCQSFCKSDIFGLASIKNSAVHAESDHFDPTRLLNFNSHTNSTEKKFYLSPQNEEWLNNSGRITRAVMQDIHSNLYQLSKTEEKVFISEFTNACESIQSNKSQILSRFKILTGKSSGQITNEFGFWKKVKTIDGDLPDEIYLIDSPETVLKLKHYLWQAELNHRAILKQTPDFLFNTLLPTVEWIEDIFIKSRFSKHSISKGSKMFEQFKDALPPIFKAQQGH
ncbi:hypothetical protein Q4503_01010 [Colwellia sp. 6_MG-2023]|uniref:hypothetical protein n=1 Tax=Colwellia sp. 6_MG-2023 TaxID=3062676 RepID=UPI0026E1A353|nr:hypothetical protein [Colwellia sp. 6_MG-2023]MDO6486258.1 hypothetical protein [Colwellia sp. 6_MG-2023]